jgi:hypothetical protein
MTDTQDLIAQLRLGASISRDRNLNLDFAKVADEAADKLEAAQAVEIDRNRRLLSNFVVAMKRDRHDWEDWPTDSREAYAAIQRELT